MINKISTIFRQHWLLLTIVICGFLLRYHSYEKFPILGETKDEYAWSFLGASLLETGEPGSWSHFAAYTSFRTISIGQDQFHLVTPALDHPPLFSLIPGFFHMLRSNQWFDAPSVKAIRFPMIFLGTANIFILYGISSYIFKNKWKSLLAAMLYATIPSVVFGSRLVVAENLLTTWTLLGVLLIAFYSRLKKGNLLIVLLSIVSVLTKFSGVIIPVSFIFFALIQKDKRIFKSGLIGLSLGIGLFCLYGGYYDWQLFTSVFFSQSSRDVGLATLINRFFLHPTIVSHIFLDGWIFSGLITLPLFFYKKFYQKKTYLMNFIKISVLMQILFIATAVGETTVHGWYAYMLFPFFVLSITSAITSRKEQTMWVFPIIWLFLLSIFRMAFVYLSINPPVVITRLLIGLGVLPLIIYYQIGDKRRFAQFSILALIVLVILANIVSIWNISDVKYWEDDEYFLPSMVVK